MRYLFVISFILMGCDISYGNCKKLNTLNSIDISNFLSEQDKNVLAKKIFTLGECKVQKASKNLLLYLDDVRIVHHASFKGMSIAYMSNIALQKITGNKNIVITSFSAKSDLLDARNKWLKVIDGNNK